MNLNVDKLHISELPFLFIHSSASTGDWQLLRILSTREDLNVEKCVFSVESVDLIIFLIYGDHKPIKSLLVYQRLLPEEWTGQWSVTGHLSPRVSVGPDKTIIHSYDHLSATTPPFKPVTE